MKDIAPAPRRAAQPARVAVFDTLAEAKLVTDIFVLLATAEANGLPPVIVREAAYEAINFAFPARDTLPEFRAWLASQGVRL